MSATLRLACLAALLTGCTPYVVPQPPAPGEPAVVVGAKEARIWLPAPSRREWRWGGPPANAGDTRARYSWQLWTPSTQPTRRGLLLWAADSPRDRAETRDLAAVLRETHLDYVEAGGSGSPGSTRTIARPEVRDASGLVFVRLRNADALRALFAARPETVEMAFVDREEPGQQRVRTVRVRYEP